MFDPKSLLNDLLGSQIPGTGSTVRGAAGKASQLAKDNPLAAGALVAVLLGTGTGRELTGTALKLGGIAANADGHIDEQERKKIADKLALSGIDAEAEQFLNDEIARPQSIDQLIAAAQTDAQKVELFTAARLTIEPDTRVERGYLDLLAGRLKLPDALIDHIEATVSAAKSAAPVQPASSRNSPW